MVQDYVFGIELIKLLKYINLDDIFNKYDKVYNLILHNFLKNLFIISENKIIHFDIKPDNIFINENCEIIFLDFGLSL